METAANQPIKTKRELVMERMASRHPDKNYSDDEALYGQIIEDVAQSDDEIAKYKEREQTFADMFTADPRSAQFMVNWRNGEDPTVGLIRQFGMEIKDAIDDPEMQEAIAQANKEYVERVAEEKEYEEMYKKNLEQTLRDLDAIQKEMGLSDEQAEGALMFLHTISSDGVLGKFSPESIKMALKAMNHDADVAQAAHEGEVKGRNIKIEEKLRTKKKGDGTAPLDGKNSNMGVKPTMPSMGAIDRFAAGESIWDRGKKR
jgi:hypothetical protein